MMPNVMQKLKELDMKYREERDNIIKDWFRNSVKPGKPLFAKVSI